MTARTVTPVDQHIGARIRLRRKTLDISQSELGKKLGVTFQQVQKYERGANRVSGSRFHDLAKILECDVQYFFDGLDTPLTNDVERSESLYDFITSADGIDLAAAFERIKSHKVRRRFIDLLLSIGDEPPASDSEIRQLHRRHVATEQAAA